MIRLTEILDPNCINLQLKGRKKKQAIGEMVQLLHQQGKIDNPEVFKEKICRRESLSSTAIGEGVAIPHIMVPGVENFILAFGRNVKGIGFDAPDKKPVRLVFLMVGPESKATMHLQILSKLVRLLREPVFRAELLEAKTEKDIVDILKQREERED